MSRLPRPWFRSGKNTWYATINGQMTSLRVTGEEHEAEAWFALFRMLEGTDAKNTPAELTIRQLCQKFLAYKKDDLKEKSLETYTYFLTRFMNRQTGKAMDLTPMDVVQYAARQEWSLSTRTRFIHTVKAVYRFGLRRRFIMSNPLDDLSGGTYPSRARESIITDVQFDQLKQHSRPDFQQYITLLWETGARPGEIAA